MERISQNPFKKVHKKFGDKFYLCLSQYYE